jgi:hypothetical protein
MYKFLSNYKFVLFVVTAVLYSSNISAQNCSAKNTTFKPGEEITYIVSYDWFIIWTEVGEITMTIQDTTFNGQPAYQFKGIGTTYKSWDWIFKVHDEFETIVEKQSLKPFQASRDISEGNYTQKDKYRYDFNDSLVFAENKTGNKPKTWDTIPITPCTFDIMSAFLYARNIDFSKYKPGATFPITILLDKEKYPIHFQYQGVEKFKLKHVGEFECIKVTAKLVEGDVFPEDEHMTIWATNDENHTVVYAESPILVGSVKVRIAEVKNNRYPFTSLKKKK